MNIKEVEKLTGISSRNIRFYEKEGLIQPERNRTNSYREYDADSIRKLKLIRILRMLDMPIEKISMVLNGQKDLNITLCEQQKFLEQKMSDVKMAIAFCEKMKQENATAESINVDECLSDIERKGNGFFNNWLYDYRDVISYEHMRSFTFTPDRAITDKFEFCNALYEYAMDKDTELIITKESMYPEFTMNGIEYTAERNYAGGKVPVSVITCTRKDALETSEEYCHGKKKWFRILHISWPGILWLIFIVSTRSLEIFESFEGWLILIALLALCIAGVIRNYHLYWNRSYEYEDKI